MLRVAGMRKKLEELPVYAKAREFSIAVTALLERPGFVRNIKHRMQISEALDSILSNMSEGYELSSDAALANFLYISKGSTAEVVTRLKAARRRGWITEPECRPCVAQGEEIGRMLGGWIKYLARCDYKDRGRHRLNPDNAVRRTMDSQDQVAANKSTLRRAAGLFGREHFDEYLQLYAEDARLHFLPPGLPQGRAGARQFYQAVFDAFDGLQLTIEDMVGEGNQVGLRFHLVGRHTGTFMEFPPTGAEIRVTGVTIFRFANGQCIERWSETNLLSALQQQASA